MFLKKEQRADRMTENPIKCTFCASANKEIARRIINSDEFFL